MTMVNYLSHVLPCCCVNVGCSYYDEILYLCCFHYNDKQNNNNYEVNLNQYQSLMYARYVKNIYYVTSQGHKWSFPKIAYYAFGAALQAKQVS